MLLQSKIKTFLKNDEISSNIIVCHKPLKELVLHK